MKLRSSIFILFLALLIQNVSGQDIIPHFMDRHPQTALTQISYFPDYEYTGGIPFLGHNKLSVVSNFSLNTLLDEVNNGTAILDIDQALEKLHPMSFIYSENLINIVTSTWKKGEHYFTFNIANRMDADIRLPRDMAELAWRGNEAFLGRTANLNGFGVDMIHYNEISLGLSQNLADKIRLGCRVKLLQGLANINTYSSDIRLTTDSVSYNLKGTADVDFRVSGPLDTNGVVIYSYNDYFFNPMNLGLGLDVGVSTTLFTKLRLSADLSEQGRIKWVSKNKKYKTSDASLSFDGFVIDSFLSLSIRDSVWKDFLDTAETIFGPERSSGAYRTYLSPKLYLSAAYDINEKNSVGLVYYNRFNKYYNYSSISLLYKKWFGDFISTTLKYSITNDAYQTFGAGLMFRIKGLHFYFISEDVVAFFKPIPAESMSFTFGMNIIRFKEEQENNLKLQ